MKRSKTILLGVMMCAASVAGVIAGELSVGAITQLANSVAAGEKKGK